MSEVFNSRPIPSGPGDDEPCDSVALAGRRFFNTNAGKKVMCKHCLKWCDDVSQFIRHVSHSKMCNQSYDSLFLAEMKKESRLNSKRKWRYENWESIKAKQGDKKERYYVTNKVKLSPEGRSFGRIFRPIFDELFGLAKAKIETYANEKSFLSQAEIGINMDRAFTQGLMDECHKEFRGEGIWRRGILGSTKDENISDEQIMQEVFDGMEKCFDYHCRVDGGIKRYDWKKHKLWLFETGIYPFSLNKAFLEIYNGQKFKIILEEAVDKALDEVFLRLIVTEGYFNEKEDLQEQLEHSYYVDLQKEVSRLATKNGIQSEMRALMDSILKKKFIDCDLEKLYEKQ